MLGAQPIVHVADEGAAFDQDGSARLVPLVVDIDGPPALKERGVVDHRAKGARHGGANLAGIVARPLAVEVRLETVTDRLVKQDAAIARREHDLHLARWRFDRVQHRERLACSLSRVPLGALLGEIAHAGAPAPSARALLALASALGDGTNPEPEQRLNVVDHRAVARDDQDLAYLFGEARLGLDNPRVDGVGRVCSALEQAPLAPGPGGLCLAYFTVA